MIVNIVPTLTANRNLDRLLDNNLLSDKEVLGSVTNPITKIIWEEVIIDNRDSRDNLVSVTDLEDNLKVTFNKVRDTRPHSVEFSRLLDPANTDRNASTLTEIVISEMHQAGVALFHQPQQPKLTELINQLIPMPITDNLQQTMVSIILILTQLPPTNQLPPPLVPQLIPNIKHTHILNQQQPITEVFQLQPIHSI